MGRPRTRISPTQQSSERDARRHSDFFHRLAAVTTLTDAVRLAHDRVEPDCPAIQLHKNLAYFLGGFHRPAGASATEVAAYIGLLERLRNHDGMNSEISARAIEELQGSLMQR